MKILIVYYSRTGNTQKMAEAVKYGVEEEGLEAVLKCVAEASLDDLIEADGIILGSPTYYGNMAAEIKRFIDDSVKYHGKLAGKVGGAFTSSGLAGGGNETTLMALIQAMLIHGMVVQGTTRRDHYGPVAVNAPDDTALENCRALGSRVATLARILHG